MTTITTGILDINNDSKADQITITKDFQGKISAVSVDALTGKQVNIPLKKQGKNGYSGQMWQFQNQTRVVIFPS